MRRIATTIGLLTAVLASPGSAQEMKTYVSDRYGASVLVPSDWKAQPPPQNDDGRTFVSPDGKAKLAIWSNFGPVTVTANFGEYRIWVTENEEEDYHLTYKAAGGGWFVFSGIKGDEIIYSRVIAACNDESLAHHLRLSYPASQKRAFDALVTRIAGSLRHVRDVGCPGGEASRE